MKKFLYAMAAANYVWVFVCLSAGLWPFALLNFFAGSFALVVALDA